ncbi:MAG: hypothetical protein EXR51_10370 [Dehalococcoidia bacterium]|nr:hypothetical protein [Dehalococcoidia bacterium]
MVTRFMKRRPIRLGFFLAVVFPAFTAGGAPPQPKARAATDPAKATAAVYWNLVHGGASRPANTYAVPTSAAGTTGR